MVKALDLLFCSPLPLLDLLLALLEDVLLLDDPDVTKENPDEQI